MADKSQKLLGSVMAGIAGGVAIGSAVTYALSDKKRRDMMQKKFNDLKNDVTGYFDSTTPKLTDKTEDMAKMAEKKIDTAKKDVKDMSANGAEKVNSRTTSVN